MQSFTDVAAATTVKNSRQQLTDNDKTIMSCQSGTAFPTTNLQVGMLCLRTDQNKLYQLKDTTPTWVLIFDLLRDFWTNLATTAAGTNTYTATLAPVPAAYVADQIYLIKFTNANTAGNPTLNLNTLGAIPIKRLGGAALKIGDIAAGMVALLHYDGTNFYILSHVTNDQTIGVTTAGTDTYTATLDPVPAAYVSDKLYFAKFTNTNTITNPTLNLNGLGAKTIKHIGGLALSAGDLPANVMMILHYNGTDFIIISRFIAPDRTQTLTDAATINWDVSLGNIAKVTLGGNRVFANPTNLRDGSYVLHIIQDGTGSRTITSWGANFKWLGGVVPTLTTTIGARDILSFTAENGILYGSLLPAFS
jgi:hypothetical protein